MTFLPRPRSIRARYTIAAAGLSLIVVVTLAASFDLGIRYRTQADIFDDTERVASQWSAAARWGSVPHTIPTYGRVNLVQLVDSHRQVVDASGTASGGPPVSTYTPPSNDRFTKLTECSERWGCVMLMAIRLSPAPNSSVVYAGLREPPILATYRLEYLSAGAVLPIAFLAAWATWTVVGRTLRPVAVIRARMSEITVSDLSLRVPVPPGEDEISLLACTANQTLARLQGAVEQQRQFASTTSHELRTPITGLRAQLEEALLYPNDVDPHETIRSALSVTDRLDAIVNDLLLIARLRAADPTPPEPIDLGALVTEEAATRVQGKPVHAHAAPGVRVRGHRIQLIRVLDNLLDNAQRHAESRVEITAVPGDGQAVVTVIDDGDGIAPSDRERVFERFTRLDAGRRRDSGGSGLGLAISRDIVQAHHGSLRVEDSPRGARFVLRLPLLGAEPAAVPYEGQVDATVRSVDRDDRIGA